MTEGVWMLVGAFALIFGILAAVTMVADRGSLDGIKSKTVGDGQHGTARWATEREIKQTYALVPFHPQVWRQGRELPPGPGAGAGQPGRKGQGHRPGGRR